VHARHDKKRSDLFLAILKRNAACIRIFLEHEKVNVNAMDDDDNTGLMLAIMHGNLDAVPLLLEYEKIDVNVLNKRDQSTLNLASACGHWDFVVAMGDRDADVNVQGVHGYAALYWVTLSGQSDTVSMILRLYVASIKSRSGSTVLDVARNLEVFDILMCLEDHNKARLCGPL
jgi:ankyrin repeat protein